MKSNKKIYSEPQAFLLQEGLVLSPLCSSLTSTTDDYLVDPDDINF